MTLILVASGVALIAVAEYLRCARWLRPYVAAFWLKLACQVAALACIGIALALSFSK